MEREQKLTLARIALGAALFLAALLLPKTVPALVPTVLFLAAYGIVGGDVLYRAARNILHGEVFDENFLMCVATVGAIALADYKEAVAVMLFYQVGELFSDCAVGKSRREIAKLMDIRPDAANLVRGDAIESVPAETVVAGDTIVVKPGERIPVDGVVTEGASQLDTAALTGESVPRDIAIGDEALSGCVNLTGLLRIRASRPASESTASRVLELIEDASGRKAKSEDFITKFARWYTPSVVIAAVLLAVIPPLLFGGAWSAWIERGLIFLVVSCPCALVISIPLSFFGGIGGASRSGVLVKGSNYLEALANVGAVVFDKTGTLTSGAFEVAAVHPNVISEKQLLEYAAYAEQFSDHPVSLSIRRAYGKPLEAGRVANATEAAGHGVSASVDGHAVLCGNTRLMEAEHIDCHECHLPGTTVHVAVDGVYAGHIVISDTVKPGAAEAIRQLTALGVSRTVMLTGDRKAVAEHIAGEVGVTEFHAELLPADKVACMERILSDYAGTKRLVAFVGDGINDAPVLTRADVGIAMGALGADAAIEAADVVLMDDKPEKIALAIRVAKRTLAIVRQNIALALTVKAAVLLLAAFGVATMWLAVFADVGVAVLAVLNAMRALSVEK